MNEWMKEMTFFLLLNFPCWPALDCQSRSQTSASLSFLLRGLSTWPGPAGQCFHSVCCCLLAGLLSCYVFQTKHFTAYREVQVWVGTWLRLGYHSLEHRQYDMAPGSFVFHVVPTHRLATFPGWFQGSDLQSPISLNSRFLQLFRGIVKLRHSR